MLSLVCAVMSLATALALAARTWDLVSAVTACVRLHVPFPPAPLALWLCPPLGLCVPFLSAPRRCLCVYSVALGRYFTLNSVS